MITWTKVGDLPARLSEIPFVGVFDGKITVVGGLTTNSSSNYVPSTAIYQSTDGASWSTVTTNLKDSHARGQGFTKFGHIFLSGGYGARGVPIVKKGFVKGGGISWRRAGIIKNLSNTAVNVIRAPYFSIGRAGFQLSETQKMIAVKEDILKGGKAYTPHPLLATLPWDQSNGYWQMVDGYTYVVGRDANNYYNIIRTLDGYNYSEAGTVPARHIRANPCTVILNGRAYFVGGRWHNGSSWIPNDVWWTTNFNNWYPDTNLPVQLRYAGATRYGSAIYVVGGQVFDSNGMLDYVSSAVYKGVL